jgi:hypothetical protein
LGQKKVCPTIGVLKPISLALASCWLATCTPTAEWGSSK